MYLVLSLSGTNRYHNNPQSLPLVILNGVAEMTFLVSSVAVEVPSMQIRKENISPLHA